MRIHTRHKSYLYLSVMCKYACKSMNIHLLELQYASQSNCAYKSVQESVCGGEAYACGLAIQRIINMEACIKIYT